jgi:hypothetical protein
MATRNLITCSRRLLEHDLSKGCGRKSHRVPKERLKEKVALVTAGSGVTAALLRDLVIVLDHRLRQLGQKAAGSLVPRCILGLKIHDYVVSHNLIFLNSYTNQ